MIETVLMGAAYLGVALAIGFIARPPGNAATTGLPTSGKNATFFS